MFIIYWIKEITIKSKKNKIDKNKCDYCNEFLDSYTIDTIEKYKIWYFHLFFIPIFIYKFEFTFECIDCWFIFSNKNINFFIKLKYFLIYNIWGILFFLILLYPLF